MCCSGLFVTLLYIGSKVHDIGLQAVQGNVLTVEDLVKKIYDVTEIPPANQKILFKGMFAVIMVSEMNSDYVVHLKMESILYL